MYSKRGTRKQQAEEDSYHFRVISFHAKLLTADRWVASSNRISRHYPQAACPIYPASTCRIISLHFNLQSPRGTYKFNIAVNCAVLISGPSIKGQISKRGTYKFNIAVNCAVLISGPSIKGQISKRKFEKLGPLESLHKYTHQHNVA